MCGCAVWEVCPVLTRRFCDGQEAHRRRILTRVASRINALLAAWRAHNPSFEADGGKVVLVIVTLEVLA